MNVVLVDTSAINAALDAHDAHHGEAAAIWARVLDGVAEGNLSAVTHGGVAIESCALVQRRLGMAALRALHSNLLPVLEIVWIGEVPRATAALLAAGRRDVSPVDWTSFELMRERGLDRALAFDEDVADQGFGPW